MSQMIQEYRKDNFVISTDPARQNLAQICDLLSRAYWAGGRTPEEIARSLQFSLVFGIFDGDTQIGLARVVSDMTIFAYLCDVFIDEAYRGQGLSKWLMNCIMAHPELQSIRRWHLATRDAHGLYRQFGFTGLETPDRYMEKFNLELGRA
ncbi:MAG: GCN5-related N-acetyltransferase [Chloroflexi bacterium]|jgi:GNAT superfamily N-acetyltransferase|nr:GCN5-related N-acetyltransferase [Chloroflexota bacterium]